MSEDNESGKSYFEEYYGGMEGAARLPEETNPFFNTNGDPELQRQRIEEYTHHEAQNWINNIPETYRDAAEIWQHQQGVIKIVPQFVKQAFTISAVADIAEGLPTPQTQVFPVSDVQVRPHQISFDFFDTTEGKIGVSNATEKHMQLEFDVYVTDLVYFYWNHGNNNAYNGLDYMQYLNNFFDSLGDTWDDEALEQLYSFEDTTEFIKFRNTLFTQYSGWVCRFVSHTFSAFDGVFTDVSYDISSGESFAKWHIKIEEALFTEDYSADGKKPTETSSGDISNNQTESAGGQTTDGGQ